MAPVSRNGASDRYLLFEPASENGGQEGFARFGILAAPTLEHSHEALRLVADHIVAVLFAGRVESDFEQFLEGVARRHADDFLPFCEFRCGFRTRDPGETGSPSGLGSGPCRGGARSSCSSSSGGARGDPFLTPARGSANELVGFELGVRECGRERRSHGTARAGCGGGGRDGERGTRSPPRRRLSALSRVSKQSAWSLTPRSRHGRSDTARCS